MAEKMKIDYDKENDVLFVSKNKKVSDSLEIDKFVIDFLKDGSVGGVEIMDASKLISNLSSIKIGKEDLENIEEAKIKYYKSKELVYVVLLLKIVVREAIESISLQIPAPKKAMLAYN